MNPNDLRGILNYVPRFRGETFVICMDGIIASGESLANVITDIAVLRSLSIRVVLIHGAAYQIERLAKSQRVEVSDLRGDGVTDDTTLELAMTVGNRVAHEILEGFAAHHIRAAVTNAVKSRPAGILQGTDLLNTGKVGKVDVDLLKALLDREVVPVVPPLGFDGNGRTLRINSDLIAIEVALALRAVKLIYLTPQGRINYRGEPIREMPVHRLAERLATDERGQDFVPGDKARCAKRACEAGVYRVHVINGRTKEGLLSEVFSNEGIGTLIYSNDYQRIRPAQAKDVDLILALARDAMTAEELSERTRQQIVDKLDEYYIFEIDRHPIACVALHIYPEEKKAELAFLCVARAHGNQGIGTRLVGFVAEKAREAGIEFLFLLSTQSFSYFRDKADFVEGSQEDLPDSRRDALQRSGRNSKVMIKRLGGKESGSVRYG